MDKKIFTSKTLEECIELASSQLNIEKHKINYEIIENKQGFFKKKVTISVKVEEKPKENNDGSIKVESGVIVIKDPREGGKPAYINPSKNVKIFVDGDQIRRRKDVFEGSLIELVFEENTAERRLNISISSDKMRVYASSKYVPQNIYCLKDKEEALGLNIEVKLKEQVFPKPYTLEELKGQLSLSGVKFGILEEELEKLTELKGIDNLLVAEGQKPIDSTDDYIDLGFDNNEDKRLLEDSKGAVDYKSIGYVMTVKKGDLLARKIEGKEGKDGLDVHGKVKKCKPRKIIKLQAGEGCEFQDENTIIASEDGKPSLKENVVSVYKVHRVDKDVDIKTGNIDFLGDVIIYGRVTEGMEVRSGHDIIVNKNVERAKLLSKGNIEVFGNVINSTLSAGKEDIIILEKLGNLQDLKKALTELVSTVDHIKQFNLLGKAVHDGEIIKVLLENKFKYMINLFNNFMREVNINSYNEEKKLASELKENLVGIKPLSISNASIINDLIERIDEVYQLLSSSIENRTDVKVSYCQDSIISSSGNIIISGKGEYVSTITANGSIEFTNPSSFARGGILKAKNDIKCKKVGSEGRVPTKLIIENKGHIWVDMAYENTCFVIGRKEYILETSSREIHVYLDKDEELVVDKFVL